MQDRLKGILNKILEWWNKFSKKQKTIILSVIGAVVVMILILAYLLGRTNYVYWKTFSDVSVTKEIDGILTEAGVKHRIESDNVTIYVDETKTVTAEMAVADSTLFSDGRLTWEDYLNSTSDMSMTNSQKNYIQNQYEIANLERQIEKQKGVVSVKVSYIPVDKTSTILDENKETQCSVWLEIDSDFRASQAKGIATALANALGNKSTESIKIIDQNGNLLYDGPEDETQMTLNNQLEATKATTEFYEKKIEEYGLKLGYQFVEAELYLKVDYDRIEEYMHEYLPAEGSDQGLYNVYEKISSENQSGNGDVPGTDSNDETDYYIATNTGGSSSYDSLKITYYVSERVRTTLKNWGVIDTAASSGAIVLKMVKNYSESGLRAQGLLGEDEDYETYILTHSDPVKVENIDPDYYNAFSYATGIDSSQLQIIIYEVPEYEIAEESGLDWNLILTIILFAIIVGLLIFVVFRVTKPEEVVETEPELSVEKLLATTKENQSLEDIEFSEASETRRMIEKFVDENPEAVAALLRNWLNDEWS